MISRIDLYSATCDRCKHRHNSITTLDKLESILNEEGWRVRRDGCICPECLRRMVVG